MQRVQEFLNVKITNFEKTKWEKCHPPFNKTYPAPNLNPLFLISQIPPLSSELIKIYSLLFKKKGGTNYVAPVPYLFWLHTFCKYRSYCFSFWCSKSLLRFPPPNKKLSQPLCYFEIPESSIVNPLMMVVLTSTVPNKYKIIINV